jgi:cytochrome c oxidase cbb3-type subunit 3/ubiquinol-cytochrome c reductase cytochrome c subunit
MKALSTSAIALSVFLITGCDLPGRPKQAPVPADQVLDFGILYGQNCAGCHGIEGKLGPAPPLNDPLFRAIVPEEDLKEIVTRGRDKTLMPAFAQENGGALTAAQIQVLVKEIKGVRYKIIDKQTAGSTKVEIVSDSGGIAPKWGIPAQPPSNVPPYRAATDSLTASRDKGVAVFARACAVCHGSQGQQGEIAINNRAFLALISNQALRRYVITGRPDLDMPDFAGGRPGSSHFTPLTDQEVNDVVALLASWRE